MYPWKQRSLQALKDQYQTELHSGYDVKESLLALSAVEFWVEQNKATTVQVFLAELDSFCEDRRKHWQQPGSYNGAIGTLGSCRASIYEACDEKI